MNRKQLREFIYEGIDYDETLTEESFEVGDIVRDKSTGDIGEIEEIEESDGEEIYIVGMEGGEQAYSAEDLEPADDDVESADDYYSECTDNKKRLRRYVAKQVKENYMEEGVFSSGDIVRMLDTGKVGKICGIKGEEGNETYMVFVRDTNGNKAESEKGYRADQLEKIKDKFKVGEVVTVIATGKSGKISDIKYGGGPDEQVYKVEIDGDEKTYREDELELGGVTKEG